MSSRRSQSARAATAAFESAACRRDAVEAVEAAGPDVQFGDAAGLPDPLGVVDVLGAEAVRRADVDERRRQAGEVGRPGRRGVGRDVRAAAGVAEQRRPADLVGRRFHIRPPAIWWTDGRVVAVVEHRAHQQLPGERRAAPVAGHQRQGSRETAAGAAADEHDPVRVDAQLVRVLRRPDQPGVAVLDRAGVRRLRRQPVLDRHQRGTDLLGEVEHGRRARRGRCR